MMIRRHTAAAKKHPRFSLYPDFIADTVDTIDFAALRAKGIKACFIDLDGTVVARSTYDVSPAIRAALGASGLKVHIATNRPKGRDLKNLVKDLGADGSVHPHFIFGKPTKRYFVNALHDKGLEPHETVMIGDRYVQDILGANRAGLYSLLVYKLDKPVNLGDRIISSIERRWTLLISTRYSR